MKQTILIAEDEPINRLILKKLLKNRYNILEAEDGAQAWQLICWRRNEIYAVLLDIKMPVMNGFEVLDKIHEANIDDLPVIVTTGVSEMDIEEKALDAGAWDFVSKPYNANVLLSRIRGAIARSQLAAFEKSKFLLEHDEFTGFYNRRRMFSEVKLMLDMNKYGFYAFIRIDINHFALYNTSFGEKEGDKLIKFLADCIDDISKQFDNCVCGRMNADVFCICVDYNNDEDIVIDSIKVIQKQIAGYRHDYPLEIAAGVYLIDDSAHNVEDYLYRAAVAAQNCKMMHKSGFCFYDAMTNQKLEKDISVTNYMQRALEEEQFLIYFQPKVIIATGKVCGAEALVRWIHPERGFISPSEFIPVFEKNGFISKLDYYVWEHTCMKLREWYEADKGTSPVSVNISRVSLYNPGLTDLMKQMVDRYDIPPYLLELEITESAYMSNPKMMESTIKSLHEAGFTILMDDFGSGYSSLNTLKSIQVDVLKIDMMFLPIEGEAERGEIILTSIIRMAKWLGMRVIVEGVETKMQRDFLEGAGCECAQGYYYARPMPCDEYEQSHVSGKGVHDDNDIDAEGVVVNSNISGLMHEVPVKNVTILVIDDCEIERTIIRSNFDGIYHIKECANAEEGLAYLQSNIDKVRLILVDNYLPGMSGLEFIKYCRQESSLEAIPKIMITSEDSVDAQVSAFTAGAYDYITKPIMREILVARVRHVMELSSEISLFDIVQKGYTKASELDFSTGLLNRLAFKSISTRILRSIKNSLEAILVIDIDNFEEVNKTYGRLAGDSAIGLVAETLMKVFTKSDVIARFGNDRFVLLMTNLSDREIVRHKAEAINNAVFVRCSKEMHIDIRLSIGAVFTDVEGSLDELIGLGEEALRKAKQSGTSCFSVYGEKVSNDADVDRAIVMICSKDTELYDTIALSYGGYASFLHAGSYGEVREAFRYYPKRIRTVCLDLHSNFTGNMDGIFECIRSNGGERIPVIATYNEGNMDQLKSIMEYGVFDILTVPVKLDDVQRCLSRSIMYSIRHDDSN